MNEERSRSRAALRICARTLRAYGLHHAAHEAEAALVDGGASKRDFRQALADALRAIQKAEREGMKRDEQYREESQLEMF